MTTDSASIEPPLLLLTRPGRDEMAELGVPEPAANLFSRIIRDPTAPDRPMRERRCTEMLCAVLMNCPQLRSAVLGWMARAAGQPAEAIDHLDWRFDTERPTLGGKRDDLRIEGWHATDDGDERLEVLWTVEAKVQAMIHESTDATVEPGEDAEEGADPPLVSQITNYDAWLARQDVPHMAGFVLATRDHRDDLPAGLLCYWTCLTWTHLGKAIMDALASDILPPTEKPLARHVLGFLRQHLWRASEMSETRLSFDHVALLRAIWSIGKETEQAVVDLVQPIEQMIRDAGLRLETAPKLATTSVFTSAQRCVVYCDVRRNGRRYVSLLAGIAGGAVRIWLECPQSYAIWTDLHAALKGLSPRLAESTIPWDIKDDTGWPVLEATLDIQQLLLAEDQPAVVRQFVTGALADLKRLAVDELVWGLCEDGEA